MQSVTLKNISKDYRTNEAYKTLRTNLEFSGADKKAIVLTSSTPNEGKSTVSLGLALSLSESGKRVLLVDADLRKSVLMGRHKVNGIRQGPEPLSVRPGTVERRDLRDAGRQHVRDLRGHHPAEPAELLGSERFAELIRRTKNDYDYVIVDAPPLGSVIDAAVIAKACDASVLVVAANTVSYKFIRTVKSQLEKTECPILGVVLNKVNMKQNRYYGKYYGNYYGESGRNK